MHRMSTHLCTTQEAAKLQEIRRWRNEQRERAEGRPEQIEERLTGRRRNGRAIEGARPGLSWDNRTITWCYGAVVLPNRYYQTTNYVL